MATTSNRDQRIDLIRKKAYELYLQRGCQPGKALEDWIVAERLVDKDLNAATPSKAAAPAPKIEAKPTPVTAGSARSSSRTSSGSARVGSRR